MCGNLFYILAYSTYFEMLYLKKAAPSNIRQQPPVGSSVYVRNIATMLFSNVTTIPKINQNITLQLRCVLGGMALWSKSLVLCKPLAGRQLRELHQFFKRPIVCFWETVYEKLTLGGTSPNLNGILTTLLITHYHFSYIFTRTFAACLTTILNILHTFQIIHTI